VAGGYHGSRYSLSVRDDHKDDIQHIKLEETVVQISSGKRWSNDRSNVG
jgi:hypothetical protein